MSGDGGTPEHVVKVEAEQFAHGPQLLPGGDAVLYARQRGRLGDGAIIAQSLETGRRHTILEPGTDARYVPTGHLVYTLGNTLLAVAFDVGRSQ